MPRGLHWSVLGWGSRHECGGMGTCDVGPLWDAEISGELQSTGAIKP